MAHSVQKHQTNMGMELPAMSSRTKLFKLFNQEPSDFLKRLLSRLRWTILATMLLITLAWPVPSRTGHMIWVFIVVFASYNLLVEALRKWVPRLSSFAWVPLTDLPVVGVLYFLDFEPGGPLFTLFYLAVISAGVVMSLWGTILYTVAVVAVVTLIALTLPGWSPDPLELRQLSVRLVLLAIVGVGTAILTRQLAHEQEQARSSRDEAARLAELDRLRKEFVSTVSHDLRTPLTAARAGLGMLETSAADQLRPDERQLLGNVRRNIERLKMMIDDLLILNQLEAGTIHLERVPLDLRTVATDALSAVHPLVREKDQTVEVDLPAPLPSAGDPRRLEHVVMNLLSNAHRHTPSGTRITIAGQTTSREVQLVVSDNGPGIPSEELEAIFQRFYRRSSGDDGSGLGLAIAKAIIERHGGRIWAESQPGAGTTFSIALPRFQEGGA
jgi:signal transduction histidine kinase